MTNGQPPHTPQPDWRRGPAPSPQQYPAGQQSPPAQAPAWGQPQQAQPWQHQPQPQPQQQPWTPQARTAQQPWGQPQVVRTTAPGFAAPAPAAVLPVHGYGQTVPAPQFSIPSLPVPSKSGRQVAIWVFAVLAVALLGLTGFLILMLGPSAATVGFLLALVPFAIVFIVARFVDRWDPEPWSMVIFALLWGGVASVVLTFLVGGFLSIIAPSMMASSLFSSVIQAPIVEELCKGIGLLLIYRIGRRSFDGPVDGIVYGMLVGAGFAFTENILYLGQSLLDGGAGSLTVTFIMRGIMSPFCHAMFTGLTGMMLGFAARKGRAGNVGGMFTLGLLGAMTLHALWNGGATLFPGIDQFLLYYLFFQVPLFLGYIFLVVMLRREESRSTKRLLDEYAAAGWFTPQEVNMLATGPGRRAGLKWAAGLTGNKKPTMKSFISDATELASTRQRLVSGRDPQAAEEERLLLMRTAGTRRTLLSV